MARRPEPKADAVLADGGWRARVRWVTPDGLTHTFVSASTYANERNAQDAARARARRLDVAPRMTLLPTGSDQ